MAHADLRFASVILRRPGTLAFAVVLVLGLLAVFCWVFLVDPGIDHSLAGRAVGGSVFLVLTWASWRVAGYPCVVITPTHLVIRNPVLCHVVPWRAVDAIEARDGLTVTLWDRREIHAWAFAGSLLTELFGDRQARRAIELAVTARAQAPAGPPTLTHLPRTTIHLHWWALPLTVVLVGAAIVIAWLLDPAATLV